MALKLAFGQNELVPDNARAALGARFIVTQNGSVDLPYDRFGMDGDADTKSELGAELNRRYPMDRLKADLSDLLKDGKMNTRQAEDFALYVDATVEVHANTLASGGYCYATAWLKASI
jgi:hypothetical protein